jgi:hypothetical protein
VPIILATQEAEIRGIMGQSHTSQIVHETLSGEVLHKIRASEWIKVKALSSSPSTAKTKKQK